MNEITKRWKDLFKKNCANWPDGLKRRYISIVNDPEEVDEEELQSSIEFIEEINKCPIKE